MVSLVVGDRAISLEEVVQLASDPEGTICIAQNAWETIRRGRQLVERWAEDRKVIYGMTTGLGELSLMLVPPQHATALSKNILRSHAAGVGEPLPIPIVRGIMLLRINTLAKGTSGVREETLATLVSMFNQQVYPRMRSQGSVGASGDLAPLSHFGLVAMGEGDTSYKGEVLNAREAMAQAGVKPIEPSYKEGLAIINGTSGMTAIAAFATHGARRLLKMAQIATALSLEVLRAPTRPFEPEGHRLRPHRGQIAVAGNLRRLLTGSHLAVNDLELSRTLEQQMGSSDVTVASAYRQNAYSLRCIPQILGPTWDALSHVSQVVETEINSADDNPLVLLEEEEVFHGGNFHGQPVAMVMDFLKIALTEIGNISERRLERFINPSLNNGLPPFLSPRQPGLDAGFEGSQYAATSLLAESRVLATPASIQSISANAGFQDVVSMGMIAARQALAILDNMEYIVGLEVLAAAQAADLVGPAKLGPASKAVYDIVRAHVPFMDEDRAMFIDLQIARDLVASGEMVQAVENLIGALD